MVVSSSKFRELYRNLNPEQKEAVDTVEGPVMVIAGPGTGKTQILTLRIANILLKTQINPGNILALTFTENGAGEMRRRLAEIIGPSAYQVGIFTFHGFCNDLIQSYPEEFEQIIGRKPANEVEQIELIKEIINEASLKFLKPFGDNYFYLKEIRRLINQLKREGIGPEDFSAILEEKEKEFSAVDDLYYKSGRYEGKMKGKYAEWRKQLDKNAELAGIYRHYQSALAEQKKYDYDDMILETAKTLKKNHSFLLRLQERFQYFLVDEHQDTNNAQNKVLELLSNFFSNPNLFVVGDEKQAIFRFQGATLENFLYFKKLYPQAKLVTLKNNYRSTPSILNLAQSFIGYNRRKISDVLEEVNEKLLPKAPYLDQQAEVYEFKQPETENYFVAQKITELLKDGVPAKEIAVIYRDNQDAWPVVEMLEKHGLPFHLESSSNVLDDPQVGKLLAILKLLNDFSSEEKLFEVLLLDIWSIPSLDIYRLNSPGVRRKIPLLELMASEKRLKELRVEAIGRVTKLAEDLLRWQRRSRELNLPALFETVVSESGFLAHLLSQKNSALALNRLGILFGEIRKLAVDHPETGLGDFIRYLNSLEEHGVGLKTGNRLGYFPQAVRLMTAHGAKGREFDYVFIVNAYDGHWGNRRMPALIKPPMLFASEAGPEDDEHSRKNDDERRLFYVAVTRARKMVYISYALRGLSEREQFPSQFLEEIKPELKKNGDVLRYEQELEKDHSVFFRPPASPGIAAADREYLIELFFKRGLSATALNNYLKCPWRYFFVNLLKIPMAKTKHQMYGTAVHAGLKDFFEALKNNEKTGADFLLARFEEALKDEPLLLREREEVLVRGREVLRSYFNFYRDSFCRNTLNEFRIHNVVIPLAGEEAGEKFLVRLTGLLDKIEYLDSRKNVSVVDYKTGRVRTRNELEGKTKSADGAYKRQLIFYKLLLDEYPAFPAKMVSGEIDFVEPDKKGVFHKEKFAVTADDVRELKELILKTAGEIINLEFWDKKCGERDCEFCRLSGALSKNW